MRLELRRRREALLAALAARLPHAEPTGIAAGVFTRIELPLRAPAENVAAAAAAAGVGVEPAGGGGLVLGYGNLPEPAIAPAVAALARAVQPYM
jgi:GntR family transcriptional regulator/MocR family aminotransferase